MRNITLGWDRLRSFRLCRMSNFLRKQNSKTSFAIRFQLEHDRYETFAKFGELKFLFIKKRIYSLVND